jgi:organic radical activating enzyme
MKDEFDLYKERTQDVEKRFTSKCMCLAKWYHANIYFQTGETHSCYHPAPHPIKLEEITANPSALHNTKEKIQERINMLEGARPKGCQYCWNIEDLNKDLISDRQIRTGSLYKEDRVNEILTNPYNFQVNPEYIELSFSNLCNFKCGYCHPKASSRFYNEIKEHGPYEKSQNHRCDIDYFKIYDEENNPYLDAWWKWWPSLSKSLNILRITGGEPLIQKSTYKMIDFLNQFPNEKLELNINSNLGSRHEIVDEFCIKIQSLIDNKKIKKFKLFSSIDTWGAHATYIRTGLNLNIFESNIKNYLAKTTAPLTFMMTFNVFSVVNFTEVLKKILEWRSEFNQEGESYEDFHRIRFDISYLKEPLQYDINILPKEEYLAYMEKHLAFIKDNVDDTRKDKFSFIEYQRFLRTYEYMKATHYEEDRLVQGRKDFYNFFSEFDRRRKTNLTKDFPEMINFWNTCKELAEQGAANAR